MNELCHRCGGTGNDPEHSGPCGECWAVNSTQREYDVVGDGFYAELCRLFDEHATRLHKVPGAFTHQLALVAADFTRKHIHTVAAPGDEVAQRARAAALEIAEALKEKWFDFELKQAEAIVLKHFTATDVEQGTCTEHEK